jgi:release factor glutamine methyltransferase
MSMQPPLRLDAALRAARMRIDRADAECLLAHVLGRPRSWLFAHGGDALDEAAIARFDALVARRSEGEPVAYLVGHRGFRNLDLAVTPDTLIPRPETELLVELGLARIPADSDARIADLGTGSGAIALAIAVERPHAQVVATDRSDATLAVARANAGANALANVEFRAGDWFAPLAGERFDVIVSNPPYIADDDPHLAQGDLCFEPRAALAAGRDGLDAIRSIVRDAPAHLVDGGWLLLEHGHDQGEAVRRLLAQAGFDDIDTAQDLEARDRVGLGRWRGGR